MADMRKVVSGESLSGENYLASTHNRFINATLYAEAQQASKDRLPKIDVRPDGICRIKNDTGGNLPRFAVVGIEEPIYNPRLKRQAFQQEYALIGVEPANPDHKCKFAILAEPIPDGEIGFAWCDGLAPALLDPSTVDNATHADVINGETGQLGGGESGAKIIWLDDTDDGYDRWAIVHLGNCSGGGTTLEGNDCPCCCKPCICRPDDEDLVEDCSGLKLSEEFTIDGLAGTPFAPVTNLVHDSGCLYVSDDSNITVCPGTATETEIGEHHWELVPSFAKDSATLTLIGDAYGIEVEYRNDRYFDERCKTLFSLATPRHEIEEALAAIDPAIKNQAIAFPCTLCVRPIGEICEECETPLVQTTCCPEGLPIRIHVRIETDCPSLCPLVEYDMDYVGADQWNETGTPGGINPPAATCVPGGGNMSVFGQLWYSCGPLTTSTGINVPIQSCSPLSATGSTTISIELGGDCVGNTVTITVTAA